MDLLYMLYALIVLFWAAVIFGVISAGLLLYVGVARFLQRKRELAQPIDF